MFSLSDVDATTTSEHTKLPLRVDAVAARLECLQETNSPGVFVKAKMLLN